MRFYIKAVPRSTISKIEKMPDGRYKAWLKAAPEKGKANEELVDLCAKHFKVPRKDIKIIAGKTARVKMIEVGNLS